MVVQSNCGFCVMKNFSQSSANVKAWGWGGVPLVAANGVRSDPHGIPYQRKLPSSRVGPCQSLRIRSASACVNAPHCPADVPTSVFGSKVQLFGLSRTPSFTPSMPSHAATAAAVAAVSLHCGTAFDATFICTDPHSDCIMSFGQLMAGAA